MTNVHAPEQGSAQQPVGVSAPSDGQFDFTSVSLRTPRLVLRPWREEDIDAVYEACQDPQIHRYVPVPVPYERSHAEAYVRETCPEGRRNGTNVVFAVVDGAGTPVASVGLHRIKDLGAPYGGVGEIGYWTAPGARGHGYMTEAARAVCSWGFEQLGLARIEWIATAGNESSWRVVEKLGFTREGTLRSWIAHRGARHDAWIGAVLRDEWSPA